MKLALLASLLVACGINPTSISGDYVGNLTYVATVTAPAGDLVGAGPGEVMVVDHDPGAIVTLAESCALSGSQTSRAVDRDPQTNQELVSKTEAIAAGRSCSLPSPDGAWTFAIASGELVVGYGTAMHLEIGGALAPPASGYVVYMFDGAAP